MIVVICQFQLSLEQQILNVQEDNRQLKSDLDNKVQSKAGNCFWFFPDVICLDLFWTKQKLCSRLPDVSP